MSQNPLQQAQLEKRSKELDAREEFLNTRHKILEKAPITFRVYEGRVEVYESKLKYLTDEIKAKEEVLTSREKDSANRLAKLDIQIKAKESKLSDLGQRLLVANENLTAVRKQSREVTDLVSERQKYLRDQEKLIDSTIEEGNNRILDLEGISQGLHEEIKLRKREKSTLELAIDELIVKYDDHKEKYDKLIEDQESRLNLIKSKHKEAENEVIKETSRLKEIMSETDKKVTDLRMREEKLKAREDALILDSNKLNDEKRRFNGQKALYGL